MATICPKCTLKHEDTVLTCDCGYDLEAYRDSISRTRETSWNPWDLLSDTLDYLSGARLATVEDVEHLRQQVIRQSEAIRPMRHQEAGEAAAEENIQRIEERLTEIEKTLGALVLTNRAIVHVMEKKGVWEKVDLEEFLQEGAESASESIPDELARSE